MDKISGILPATARVTSVDLRNSGTARSGMPNFGREVGVSSVVERQLAAAAAAATNPASPIADTVSLATSGKASLTLQQQLAQRNPATDPKSEIVKKMADNFFNTKNNVRPSGEENFRSTQDAASDMTVEFKNHPLDDLRVREPSDSIAFTEPVEVAPEENDDQQLATGQYLDVRA